VVVGGCGGVREVDGGATGDAEGRDSLDPGRGLSVSILMGAPDELCASDPDILANMQTRGRLKLSPLPAHTWPLKWTEIRQTSGTKAERQNTGEADSFQTWT